VPGREPGPSGVVPSSLLKGDTILSKYHRHALPGKACLWGEHPHSTFTPLPTRHLGSLTAANSVSFDLIASCSSF